MPYETRDAVDFLQKVYEVESAQRSQMQEDLRFSLGQQWSAAAMAQRFPDRPCMVVNKIDPRVRQVTNAQRQQRPRLKAHPMDAMADVKIAEVITGLMRHVQYQSDADEAYDTAFQYACRVGVGYFRIITDYAREDSFDQEIFIRSIQNPFSVYFDAESDAPDGSDANECLITDLVPRETFKKLYPGVNVSSFSAGCLDISGDVIWHDKDHIRIAEHFRIEQKKEKLLLLSDGTTAWASDLPDTEILSQFGLTIVNDRMSQRKTIQWRKITSQDVLEEREFPGRFLPVIPVYGDQFYVDGKRLRFGMVRHARDPQISYNFFRTTMMEAVAMAPKAKWMMADGQDEDYENEWARANISPFPVLHYKQTDADGNPAPAPSRIQPEPSPQGAAEEAGMLSQDLDSVLGVYDASARIPGPMSGKALNAEQSQADNSNFHYGDNLTRSIKHAGRIMLDLIPKIYDAQRIVRIIGEDDKPQLIKLNQPGDNDADADDTGNDAMSAIQRIENDVTIGQYDITLEVGPGSLSKRQESLEAMMAMVQAQPDIAKIAGDLIVRNMDFPDAEIVADRLAAGNPLAQIDKKSDMPPAAQMAIKQAQAQVQQIQQELAAAQLELKTRGQLEQMKQGEESKRHTAQLENDMRIALMKSHTEIHSDDVWVSEEARQVDIVAQTDMAKEHLQQAAEDRRAAEKQAGEDHRAALKAATELHKAHITKKQGD